MKNRRALVTGITGQDGSYLAELLLGKGYEVHGVIRRSSSFNTGRIDHLYQDPHGKGVKLHLHFGDLVDEGGLRRLLSEVEPDEIYNLAAQSHVRVSFDQPTYTVEVDALGTIRFLDATRDHGRPVRFYQASSSEMFGSTPPPQGEDTPFHPRSPYACAKVYSFHQVVNYREAYGMYAVNGILFNHESPRRGETFVTRKVTRAATRIKLGLQEKLFLGNLEPLRDWGFAGDYVEGMWRMLQQDIPADYVLATGKAHSVRELCEKAFSHVNLDYRDFVEEDPKYRRPSEVDHLEGDATKARTILGWEPRVDFDGLIGMMIASDLRLAEREKLLRDHGHDERDRS